jgi:AcrR family transcriptional regulator
MPRDATPTREAILVAARAEFSAQGLAGARIDRIAASAGCSKERIYSLLGDKEELFRRTLADMLEEMRLATVVRETDDVTGYVRSAYEFHRRNPHLLRMLLWEALECPEGLLPDESARRDCYARSANALSMEAPGADDSRLLLLTLIGLTAWPHAVPTLARVVTDDDSRTEEGQRRLQQFLVQFAAGGVQAIDKAAEEHKAAKSAGRRTDVAGAVR